MTTDPTAQDLANLKEHFQNAMVVKDQVGSKAGYPTYPDAISSLMHFITASPWCNTEYRLEHVAGILDRIDFADMTEVRSALTAIARSERFSMGAWLSALNNGSLSVVIDRAEQLVGD